SFRVVEPRFAPSRDAARGRQRSDNRLALLSWRLRSVAGAGAGRPEREFFARRCRGGEDARRSPGGGSGRGREPMASALKGRSGAGEVVLTGEVAAPLG